MRWLLQFILFLLITTSASSQEIENNEIFLDNSFVTEIYRSALHSSEEIILKYCPDIDFEKTHVNDLLSDTVPRIGGTRNGEYRSLIDFDKIVKEETDSNKNKKIFGSFYGPDFSESYEKLSNQKLKIELSTCQKDCEITISFSSLFVQNDVLHGYIYVKSLKGNNCLDNLWDLILVFEVDNWDNMIKTKVKELYYPFIPGIINGNLKN